MIVQNSENGMVPSIDLKIQRKEAHCMRLCVPIPCFFHEMDFISSLYKVRELGFDAAETYNWRGLDLDLSLIHI